MGNFANTLFSALLGWIQGAVQWLWRLASQADAGAWMTWVLDNWLVLVILLCVTGIAVDLLVYLIRWQPWRVWRSFLKWLRGDRETEAEELPPEPRGTDSGRHWLFADGTTAPAEAEIVPAEAEPAMEEPTATAGRVAPVRRRRAGRMLLPGETTQAQFHQPYYPPQWKNAPEDGNDHDHTAT